MNRFLLFLLLAGCTPSMADLRAQRDELTLIQDRLEDELDSLKALRDKESELNRTFTEDELTATERVLTMTEQEILERRARSAGKIVPPLLRKIELAPINWRETISNKEKELLEIAVSLRHVNRQLVDAMK